jgi:Hydrazine synthase alpha subunit middle domain
MTALCSIWAVSRLSAAPQNKPASPNSSASASRPDILFVQTSAMAVGALAQRFPKGSAIVLLKGTAANASPVRLTDGFFAAANPQVNFDATKILFSAQKAAGERWQIWEMDLNGANKRQITKCAEDCLRGAYLPAEEIAFTVENSRGNENYSYLAVMKSDGSSLRRITFGPAEFRLETVLRDGRIVASAPWPLEQDTATRTLYTVRPDGTALESLRCEHGQSSAQSDAAELEDGTVVFVANPSKSTQPDGALVKIQRGSAGATAISAQKSGFASPSELSGGELLLSRASAALNGERPKLDLYTVSEKSGATVARIYADTQLSSVQAIPVTPHTVPKRFWSTVDPESRSGYFISLNSYVSADAPGGRFTKTIAQVRVLTVNATDGADQVLGEAPVESDGSFYVSVPANTPVRFLLLDAKGQPIREERSWVWTRPGEQRGCTGCHGNKNVAPENHWPMTLKRFDTPIRLGETNHAPALSTTK